MCYADPATDLFYNSWNFLLTTDHTATYNTFYTQPLSNLGQYRYCNKILYLCYFESFVRFGIDLTFNFQDILNHRGAWPKTKIYWTFLRPSLKRIFCKINAASVGWAPLALSAPQFVIETTLLRLFIQTHTGCR